MEKGIGYFQNPDDLINCFETPTVNLYLELSVVIYFMGFKVPTSSDKLPRMHVQAQKA